MTHPEPAERSFVVEELNADDTLLAAPVEMPPPLVDPRPALLNTHEMAWVEFERLVVDLARNVDGLRHVARWGGPGQSQHGLDVIGQKADGSWVGYQAKQVDQFNERKLAQAVEKFAGDRKPLGISHLIICVSIEATRFQLREELARLVEVHPDLNLELYDREVISAMLRDRPDIVRRFFGDATAGRFCTSISDDTPSSTTPEMDRAGRADALMRGPIEAIDGLASTVARAEALAPSEPLEAANLLEGVAVTLQDRKFRFHAKKIRLRAAEVLGGAEPTESALVLIRLLEDEISTGDTTDTQVVNRLHQLRSVEQVRADVEMLAAAALALHQATTHPFDDLSPLSASVDALAASASDSLPLYAQGLGEAAIASEQPKLILDRAAVFEQAAAISGSTATGIRIRLALAEATQNWRDLVESARRRRLAPPLNALVFARHARYLSLIGSADDAASHWWEAINAGALAGLGEDTAAWLYSVRQSVSRYGPISDDFETHPLAQAMSASGGDGRLIPSARNHREDALAALRNGKLPRAVQAARRSLRDAVTAAHFVGEHLAIDLLADAFLASGETERAVHLLVRIGESKRLESVLKESDDVYVDFRSSCVRPAPWQRAAAYKGIAAEADLVPDDHLDEIFERALGDFSLSLTGGIRESGFTPSIHTSALDVLASLSERAKLDPLHRLLGLLAPLAPREPNHYRFTDDSHVRVLSGVLQSQPDLHGAALEQIYVLLAANDHVSDQVVSIAGEAIEDAAGVAPAVMDRLRELSSISNAAARLTVWLDKRLLDLGPARRALQALTAPWQDPPGVISGVGGLTERATLVRSLPEADRDLAASALLRRAQNKSQIAANRNSALNAIRVLSDVVSQQTKQVIFDSALNFARGSEDGSARDETLAGPAHPLSLFKISLGGPSLVAAGLKLAAVTATGEQAREVEGLAVGLLNGSDERLVRAAALALAWLPEHPQALPAAVLAIHPDDAVRSLAAIRWARQTPRDEDLGMRLAQDLAPEVRRALAHAVALQSTEEDSTLTRVRSALLRDPRFSIRRLAASGRG